MILSNNLLILIFILTLANASVSDLCTTNTASLEDNAAVVAAYGAMKFHSVNSDDSSDTLVLDYSVSEQDMLTYQSVCATNGGVYEKLTFTAICTESDKSGKVILTEHMLVNAFPQCYGTVCTEDETEALFEEFILRPKELLNEKHSKHYTECTGELLDESDVSGASASVSDACTTYTALLEDNTLVVAAYNAMEFDHDDSTNTLVLDYSVNEQDMASYQSVCAKSGGFYEKLTFTAICTESDDSGKVILTEHMQVTAFPRCYAKVCTEDEAETLFEDFTLRPVELMNEMHFKKYTECTGELLDESDVSGASASVSEVCTTNTASLEDNAAVVAAYDAMEVEHNDSSNTLVLDYSVNKKDMVSYQSVCATNGGVYTKLDFTAICTESDESGKVILTEHMQVTAFPRCYDNVCTEDEAEALFEDFTLRPTELLNEMHSKKYTACTGELLKESKTSSVTDTVTCLGEKAAMRKHTDIAEALDAAKPLVNRFLLESSFKESEVDSREVIKLDYDGSLTNKFRQACEDNDFVYLETESFAMDCIANTTEFQYRIAYFPTCIGKSCNTTEYLYNFETMKERAFLYGGTEDAKQFQCQEVDYKTGNVRTFKLLLLYLLLMVPFIVCCTCRAMIRRRVARRNYWYEFQRAELEIM